MTTWIILRAAGIGSYLMLFGAVAFGLVATSAPFGKRIAKQSATLIHQFLSTVGLVLLGVHIGGLLADSFVHFGPKQILVPGASTYRPVAVALGVVGMYAMVLVLVSSWFRKRYSSKLWRRLHTIAVPAFVLAMLHGVFAGADATKQWMFLMYVITACVVVFLLVLRGLTVGLRPARRVQSSPTESLPVARSDPRSSVAVDGAPVDGAVERPVTVLVGAETCDRLGGGLSPPPDDGRSGARAGAETRIGVAGSVKRVPATAKAPAIRAAETTTPAAPHPTIATPRGTMLGGYRAPG